MVRLIDAHIHLSDPEYEPILDVLKQMVDKMDIILIAVSEDLATSERTLQLADRWGEKVIPFVGIHPWSVKEDPDLDLDNYRDFLNRERDRIKGIGEIGLDKGYVGDEGSYQLQKRVFNSLLEVAEKYKWPVSVHSRNSQSEVIDILSTYSLKSVLLHWFSGGVEDLNRSIDRGYFISFGPSLIYSKKAQILAKNTPKELILVESDGPVRYKACFEGRIGLPTFIPSVIFALTSILKMEYATIASMIYENSKRYLLEGI
ncbi:MAG: TatD family hydrolase [Nitrososphaerota archaeon]|nr:TatD family hydrolase [Nitrososphaerota archaeon]